MNLQSWDSISGQNCVVWRLVLGAGWYSRKYVGYGIGKTYLQTYLMISLFTFLIWKMLIVSILCIVRII